MSIIKIKHKGSFRKTDGFFKRALKKDYMSILHKYGKLGVDLLREATPTDSGETAAAWDYEIEEGNGTVSIFWTNSHKNQGCNVAILLIHGHGLYNGGYVKGKNFVRPALRPMLQEMADKVWKEVTK